MVNIMIIDDDEELRDNLVEILQNEGFFDEVKIKKQEELKNLSFFANYVNIIGSVIVLKFSVLLKDLRILVMNKIVFI